MVLEFKGDGGLYRKMTNCLGPPPICIFCRHLVPSVMVVITELCLFDPRALAVSAPQPRAPQWLHSQFERL